MTYLKEHAPKPAVKPDTVNPKPLIDFMMTRWKPQSKKLPKAISTAKATAARRAALSKLFANHGGPAL